MNLFLVLGCSILAGFTGGAVGAYVTLAQLRLMQLRMNRASGLDRRPGE